MGRWDLQRKGCMERPSFGYLFFRFIPGLQIPSVIVHFIHPHFYILAISIAQERFRAHGMHRENKGLVGGSICLLNVHVLERHVHPYAFPSLTPGPWRECIPEMCASLVMNQQVKSSLSPHILRAWPFLSIVHQDCSYHRYPPFTLPSFHALLSVWLGRSYHNV